MKTNFLGLLLGVTALLFSGCSCAFFYQSYRITDTTKINHEEVYQIIREQGYEDWEEKNQESSTERKFSGKEFLDSVLVRYDIEKSELRMLNKYCPILFLRMNPDPWYARHRIYAQELASALKSKGYQVIDIMEEERQERQKPIRERQVSNKLADSRSR